MEYAGISVNVFGRTDVGLVREHNEDNFIIADLTKQNRSIKPEVRIHAVGSRGSLFAVCDGMGGAAAGEVASQIAVDTIYELMQEGEDPDGDDALARKLNNAIIEAGHRIYTAARVNRRRRGMGTTVTALLASLTGNFAGITIALVHLCFNIAGTLLFLPLPFMRWPIALSTRFAAWAPENRVLAMICVAMTFFGLPGLLIFLTR